MSEFDKEAEREKLREKFEQDSEKRKHTQQMSELLLKGATMTNRHCGQCGDPIFSQNGEQFCPTCGANVGGEEASDQPADAERPDEREGTSGAPVKGTPVEETPVEGTPEENQTADRGRTGGRERPPKSTGPSASSRTRTESSATREGQELGVPNAQSGSAARSPAGSAADASVDDDIAAARASLARTVRTFAEIAESTDDPRRAVDTLEAAREAAAALEKLE